LTLDLSWRPNKRDTFVRRNGLLIALVGVLIAANIAMFVYHGDPRNLLKPRSKPEVPEAAAPATTGQAMSASQGDTAASVSKATVATTFSALAAAVAPSAPASPAVPTPHTEPTMPFIADDPDAGAAELLRAHAAFVGPPLPLDPLLGLRSQGVVQRVERLQMRHHQTPSQALLAMGIRHEDVSQALGSLKPLVDFRRFRATDAFKACFDAADTLVSLEISRGPLDQTVTRRTKAGWQAERIEIPVDTVVAEVSGEVRTSLWDALVHAGESPALVQSLVDVFAYEIDFYSEVKPGDTFGLLVEKRYANGQFLGYGDMTAAEFVTRGAPHRAFMHRTDGATSYFDAEGRSMRKQLLRTPLRYGPVTSGFGVRHHPVLHYTRNHNGTDYGVPVGTPVWSVGEGRVITAGWHGGYGRLVEVSHPNGWVSQYAHLSKIMVRPGQHVHQKDIVGLVGQTGLATGPHLHYGLKKNGLFVNSLAQKFERAKSLSGAELEGYKVQVHRLLDDLSKVRVAQKAGVAAGDKS
jgi:murein DD-endopeptidase MepM/ murein hydrolase activator NlpD